MSSPYGDPYEGKIEVKESPFNVFIGRHAREGYWWFQYGDKSAKLKGWEGIAVDGSLFRVTGSHNTKPVKASSNLCSPLQRELKILHKEKTQTGEITTEIGIGQWKELSDKTSVGKFTKVIAVRLTKVILQNDVERPIDELAEIRIKSKQMVYFGNYLKGEDIRDSQIMYAHIKSGDEFKGKTDNGVFQYSHILISPLPEEKLTPVKDKIKKDFDDILHYVEVSAPGHTSSSGTESAKEPEQPVADKGEWPEATDAPAEGFNEGEDDLGW